MLPVTPPWFFPMPVVEFQVLVSINDKNRQESKVSIVHKYLDQKYISVTHIYIQMDLKILKQDTQQQQYMFQGSGIE